MSTPPLHLAVVGNGAIGNLLAFRCHQQQLPVTLLLRENRHVALNITDLDGSQHTLTPNVSTIPQAGEADVVILPLKAYQIEPALKALAQQVKSSAVIVLMHNGMGTEQSVQRYLPDHPVVAVTTSYGAFKPAPDQLEIKGYGDCRMGWLQHPNRAYGEVLKSMFERLLPPLVWYDDVRQALWRKLAINAVINPLTAIDGVKNGELANDDYNPIIQALCEETARVMVAEGYATKASDLMSACLEVVRNTAANLSSMYQDVAQGRQTEIDFINGYIVQCGLARGVATPTHKRMLDAIHDLP